MKKHIFILFAVFLLGFQSCQKEEISPTVLAETATQLEYPNQQSIEEIVSVSSSGENSFLISPHSSIAKAAITLPEGQTELNGTVQVDENETEFWFIYTPNEGFVGKQELTFEFQKRDDSIGSVSIIINVQ